MSDQSRYGPITRRVTETLRRQMRMKVVDLAAFRMGKRYAEELQKSVTPKEQLAKTDPAHAAYVYAQNQMSILAEQLLQLPEMKSFVKQIGPAEDEYAPSWPPISPISNSFFVCWSTYDLGVGARRETLGDVIIAVAAECGTEPRLLDLMKALQSSRMGIYNVQAQDGTRVWVEDLATGHRYTAASTSGYSGEVGEIWFTRLLPPPDPGADHVVFTSPYVLTAPPVDAWKAYLDRVASNTPVSARAETLEQHFKWGPTPRYWLEFVFEAYSRYEDGAIFLHGLPDVAESRPHSPSFRPPAAQSASFTKGGFGSVSPDRKISEAFLEFAEPLLVKEGEPPTPKEVEGILGIAFTVWNAVVLDTVHGSTDWVTQVRQQVAAQLPLAATMEEMIARKRSLFGDDLRLVGRYEVVAKGGEWRLRVEARSPMSFMPATL